MQTSRRLSDRAIVLDALLRDAVNEGLVEVVTRLRAEGLNPREIAWKIEAYTDGERLSHETIRRWLREWEMRGLIGAGSTA